MRNQGVLSRASEKKMCFHFLVNVNKKQNATATGHSHVKTPSFRLSSRVGQKYKTKQLSGKTADLLYATSFKI